MFAARTESSSIILLLCLLTAGATATVATTNAPTKFELEQVHWRWTSLG